MEEKKIKEKDRKEETKIVSKNGMANLLLWIVILLVSCNIALTLLLAGSIRADKKSTAGNVQAQAENATDETKTDDAVEEATKDNVVNDEESDNQSVAGNDAFSGVEAAMLKDVIKESMESGESVMSLLRRLYPEYVVVFKNSAYQFIPINETLAQNKIKQENIKVLENGEIQYVKDSKVVSKKGIDVSKYQGNIDWDKVAADGVEFAMIRLGYRGYGTGALVLDELFEQNIKGAKAAGIKVGVYFFSQAISNAEAKEEAEFVIEHLKSYKLDYPIAFDTEEIANDSSRMDGMTPDEITDTAITFCDTVEAAGYDSMIYANLRWFNMSMNMEKLEKYDKWYAYYDNELYFPYKVDIWQYSDAGQVDGINGTVDLNIQISYEEQ